MTLIPNIASIPGTGTGISLTSQGSNLVQPGVLGFMNMMLNPLAAGQMSADGMTLNGNNLQALVEKIAASLNLDPADPNSLLQILEQVKGQQATIAAANLDDIKPTLMSDLGASSAATLQETSEGTDLAAMLNQMDVGGEEMVALNTDLLQKLKDLFQQIVPDTLNPTAEQLAQFSKEAQALLKTQGISTQDSQRYLDTLSAALDVKLTAESAKTLKESVEKKHIEAAKDAPLNTPTAASADKKDAAAAETAKKPTPTNFAMINALAGAEGETKGLGAGGFGDKNNPIFLASLKHGSDLNLQSLSNYMTTGRSLPGETAQMIALQMQRNMAQKVDTFTIQLEPLDLGRLDIQIKFDKDGAMKAHMSAERPETLSMLQRDQNQLSRVLHEAGIDMDENSLSFDLRQQRDFDSYGEDGSGRTGRNERGDFHKITNGSTIQAQIAIEAAGYVTHNRVDIRV